LVGSLQLKIEEEAIEIKSMAEKTDVNAKWDACLDLSVRRFVYSSLAGAFGGLLLFSQSLPFLLSLLLINEYIFIPFPYFFFRYLLLPP
jgi:inner membrane organizing system protein 1